MTYYDVLLAAQLMSEERVGAPIRKYQRGLASADNAKLSRLTQASRSPIG